MKKITLLLLVAIVPFLSIAQKRSSKKTPAKISKRFGLNDYYGELNSQFSDNISSTSAELMLKKNMEDLSKLSFMQEAKKNFDDGRILQIVLLNLNDYGWDLVSANVVKEEGATVHHMYLKRKR